MPRSVLITGASGAVGRATALELAAHGWDVIAGVASLADGRALQSAASEQGQQVRTVLLDVDDPVACREGVAKAEQFATQTAEQTDRAEQRAHKRAGGARHRNGAALGSHERPPGGLYALVNAAAFAQPGAIEDISDDLARAQFETNVIAPMRLARLVIPGMRSRGEGRVINLSSVAGRSASPFMGWFAASKHALEAASDALRVEVEGDNIRVVLIEPGSWGATVHAAAAQGLLPEPTTATYAAAYAKAEATAGPHTEPGPPVWVARAIRVALSNPVPLARYVVGADAVSGILTEQLVPTVVTDYVKAVGSGLKRTPIKLPFLPGG